MKKFILALFAAALITPALSAQVYVKGYVTKNGTYVAPHYRSSPNTTTLDNYSTRGNVNPYTGQVGTRDPYPSTTYTPATTNRPVTTYTPPSAYTPPCYFNCPR